MRPHHAGPSKKKAQKKKVERVARQANLGNTVSTSKRQRKEAGRREETPNTTQAPLVELVPVSAIQETCTAPSSQEASAASSAPPLGSSTDEGHPAHPEPQSLSDSAPTGGDRKSESTNEGETAVSGEAINAQSTPPQIVQSDETVAPQAVPSGETVLPQVVASEETVPLWDHDGQVNVAAPEPAAVQDQAAEVRLANLLGYVHPSEQGCLDVEANEELDTGATFSLPMVEDQVEDQVEFEFEPPCTTFDPPPPFTWQPLPYSENIEDQCDIILDDIVPECAEDATMETVEPDSGEVAGSAMVAQVAQPLPWTPLGGFCPPTILPCPSVEEGTSFVDTRVPNFEPLVLDGNDGPNSMVSQGLLFPQTAPLRSNASLWVPDQAQSSPLMAEIEPPTYDAPMVSCAPIFPVPGAPVSQTAFCPQSSPSPPRAASTLASLSTYSHTGKRKREVEDLGGETEGRKGETEFGVETGGRIQGKTSPRRCVVI